MYVLSLSILFSWFKHGHSVDFVLLCKLRVVAYPCPHERCWPYYSSVHIRARSFGWLRLVSFCDICVSGFTKFAWSHWASIWTVVTFRPTWGMWTELLYRSSIRVRSCSLPSHTWHFRLSLVQFLAVVTFVKIVRFKLQSVVSFEYFLLKFGEGKYSEIWGNESILKFVKR